jgi:hypothetical protein
LFSIPLERPLPVRAVGARPSPASSSSSDLSAEQQAEIAAQHAAFDFQLAEEAELMREHEALQTLIMEQLKNEDEIMKKWIALI